MRAFDFVFTVLVILALVAGPSQGLKCHRYVSGSDEEPEVVDCPDYVTNCYKTTFPEDNRVFKSCLSPEQSKLNDTCIDDYNGQPGATFCSCTTDLCNTASGLGNGFLTYAVIAAGLGSLLVQTSFF